MGHNCNDGSCSTESHNHGGCAPKCGHEWSGCDHSSMMLDLADKAWMCLMKEKMKAHWEKQRGPNMDKIAKATVEASMAYWQNKMDGMKKAHEHRDKMMQAMG